MLAGFWRRALVAAIVLSVVGCGGDHQSKRADCRVEASDATTTSAPAAADSAPVDPLFKRFEGAVVTDERYGGAGLDLWVEEVPGVAEVRIPSSIDDHEQPAMWLAHDRDVPRPLLVVLHSWGADYQQHFGIPYGRWAYDNGWAMIHPDFGGSLDAPEAAGSECSIADVLDAVDFARSRAAIDDERVFLVGFSSGGMQALDVAGHHPERFAGVVAWVPIYDLVEWYGYAPGWAYASEVAEACGGDPLDDLAARAECTRRSPVAHLDAARHARLPVFIGHGSGDYVVPIVHSARAFNHLADPADRFDEAALAAFESGILPAGLGGRIDAPTYFGESDPVVLFATESRSVTLVVFEGGHEGVYNPGLEWLVERATER